MPKIIKPGKNLWYPDHGRIKCSCECIFDYTDRDVSWDHRTFLPGPTFYYVTCPNTSCVKRWIIKDCRVFGWLWRILDGPKKARIVPA